MHDDGRITDAPARTTSPVSERLAMSPADRHKAMLGERIESVHRQLVAVAPAVDQVVWMRYDAATDRLETITISRLSGPPLCRYEGRLSDNAELCRIVRERKARILDSSPVADPAGEQGSAEPANGERDLGWQSIYAVPLFEGEAIQGLLCMASVTPDVFTPETIADLEVYVGLMRVLVCRGLTATQAVEGAERGGSDFAYLRDVGIGTHLDRMARYSRMIARQLSSLHALSEQFIEQVFLFAPLHDIGKVGISDAIVLKPSSLTEEERGLMATHVVLGMKIIEQLVEGFQLESLAGIGILRNIVAGHHEMLDGSGYPLGLVGAAIPLECRIVAVADIFDALTSRRSYKDPISVEESLAMLDAMVAGGTLDGECVAALHASRRQIDDVIRVFGDQASGSGA
jgi:HD-GYP domain-containing protein (c-di-GMP phosphodiesterase class II)